MLSRRSLQTALSAAFLVALSCTAAFAADGASAPANYGVLSLLPPAAAIILCLTTREVIPSLFVGSWLAGMIVCGGNPVTGFGSAVNHVCDSLGDPWGARIFLTCIVMSGMVGVMQVGGGVRAAIAALSRRVKSSRSAMLFTELSGLAIFFEDYVTTAVVGATMTPLSDNYRVSKEKLTYLVDSTAAPVACIAGVSSWVAYMVGQIGHEFSALGVHASFYTTYLRSIPFVFYNLLALLLLTTVVLSGRDFGPMLRAERRARAGKGLLREGASPLAVSDAKDAGLEPDDGAPLRVMNFVLPVLFLVGSIIVLLLISGGYPAVGFREAMGEADSAIALIHGSFAATVLTLIFYSFQRLSSLGKMFRGFLHGGQAVFSGAMILIFAWGISSSIKSVGTADYLVSISRDFLTPQWIPLLTFLTGMVVSFCTGTSYGTMGILMPIVVPLMAHVSGTAGVDMMTYTLPTIGAVFAGAVWGDHCSPISDTTIMSSMFCGGDHIDHVRTQIPYASLAGLGAFVAYACIGFGFTALPSFTAGAAVVLGVFFLLSSKVEDYAPAGENGETVSLTGNRTAA